MCIRDSYSTNVITCAANLATAVSAGDNVHCATSDQDNPVGIALLPVRDKDAHMYEAEEDVTSKLYNATYGSIALTGRFKANKLHNLHVASGTPSSGVGFNLAGWGTTRMAYLDAYETDVVYLHTPSFYVGN